MKILFLSIFFILSFANSCIAQSYFNSLHFKPFAFSVLPMQNGEVIIGGGEYLPTNLEMALIKFDKNGDTIWKRNFFSYPLATNTTRIIQYDSVYFLSISALYDSASAPSDILIAKHQISNGDTIWTKKYAYFEYDYMRDALVLPNGNILMAGHTGSFGSSYQGFLMCVDNAGNLLWKKTYGGTNDEFFYSLHVDKQGNIIMGGAYSQANDDNAGYVVKTDANGNLIWEKYYGKNNNKQDNMSFVTVLPDNNLLMAHSEGYSLFNYKLKGTISKLNTIDGSVIWKKIYKDSTTFYNKPILNADSSFVISGTIKTYDGTVGNDYSRGLLVKFTVTGDTVWSRIYRTKPNNECYFYDMNATPDSGYVMCGWGVDTANVQRAWIVKTDCMGADSIHYYFPNEVCTTTGWVTGMESEPKPVMLSLSKQDRFEVFPNPASTELSIVTTDNSVIRIMNSLGETILEKTIIGKTVNIDLSAIPAGSYTVLKIGADGNTGVKKLSIIR